MCNIKENKMTPKKIAAFALGTVAILCSAAYAADLSRPCPGDHESLFRLNRSIPITGYGHVIVDQLLVKFRPSASEADIASAICTIHADVSSYGPNWTVITLRRSWTAEALITARLKLLKNPAVTAVEYNNTDAILAQ